MTKTIKIPIIFNRKENCCGCSACYASCKNKAIEMKPDEEGFEYPIINESKCMRCGNCLTVCPIKNAR